MLSRCAAVLLATAAVLAGCGGVTDDGEATTPTPDEDHPWRGETLVIALETLDGEYDRYNPLLQEPVESRE
jgi:ABC-type glycerol-3-phosphate transport system substrate-binding protein